MSEPTLLRLSQVLARTGLSRSTLFRLVAAGKFPSPRRLRDVRVSAWNSIEVDQWVTSQINGE